MPSDDLIGYEQFDRPGRTPELIVRAERPTLMIALSSSGDVEVRETKVATAVARGKRQVVMCQTARPPGRHVFLRGATVQHLGDGVAKRGRFSEG